MYSILGKSYQYSKNEIMDVVHQATQKGFRTAGVEEMTRDEKKENNVVNRTLLDLGILNPYHYMSKINFKPEPFELDPNGSPFVYENASNVKRFDKFFEDCQFLLDVNVNYEYLLVEKAKIYSYPRRLDKITATLDLDHYKGGYSIYTEKGKPKQWLNWESSYFRIDKSEMFNLSDNFELRITGYMKEEDITLNIDLNFATCKNLTITLPETKYISFGGYRIIGHNFGSFETITINGGGNQIIFESDNLNVKGLIINNAYINIFRSRRNRGICEYYFSDSTNFMLNRLIAKVYVVHEAEDIPEIGRTFILKSRREDPRDGTKLLLTKEAVKNLEYNLDEDVIAFDDVNKLILYHKLIGHDVTYISNYSDLFYLTENDGDQ